MIGRLIGAAPIAGQEAPKGTAPVITLHPSNQSAGVGATATFTAAASGTPAPTGQWWVLKN